MPTEVVLSVKLKSFPPAALSWTVWGLAAAFYLNGFYQRIAPAVMTDFLMADFHIGAAALGNLSAYYFYSYVFMQIPTGILADTWGPRKLLTTGAIAATIGAFLFAMAPSVLVAKAGRFLIGGAVGVGWVALLKLNMHWFPRDRFAMTTGLALLAGLLGAIGAGVPLRLLVELFGWRPVMFFSAVGVLIIAVAIWFLVRDDPTEKGYKGFFPFEKTAIGSIRMVFSGLGKVLTYKNTWLISLTPAGMAGSILAFSGLWGVPFLTTHYGLTPSGSAALTSMLLVAWGLGGPVLGGLSDRMGRRKTLYVWGSLIACLGWFLILFVPQISLWVLVALLMMVGFSSGCIIIGFAFVKESVPSSLTGTVSGVCNMGVMIGPMVLQPAMGWMMDRNWTGTLEHGIRIYSLEAYQAAFALMMGWSILSVVLISLTTETRCRQTVP